MNRRLYLEQGKKYSDAKNIILWFLIGCLMKVDILI